MRIFCMVRPEEIANLFNLFLRQRCIGHNNRGILNVVHSTLRRFAAVSNQFMLDLLDATKTGYRPEAFVRGLFAPREVLGKVIDSGCIHRCAEKAQVVSVYYCIERAGWG